MAVKFIPDNYHSVTPYLMTKGAADAIEFYKRAFGAVELFKMDMPGGKIGHAEIRIGDSRVMLADDCGGESPFRSPQSGGSPIGLHVYVEDVDAVFARAVDAGAKTLRPVQDQFYGDGQARWKILSDISGSSQPTKKSFRRMKSSSEPRRCSSKSAPTPSKR